MTPRTLGYLRTAATLGVLGLILAFAVTHGLSSVAEPFPQSEEKAICVDTPIAAGDSLRPGTVTVSVINASERNGLAGGTLNGLEELGFARGELANNPDPDIKSVQIWTSQRRSAAVRLVRTYLGGKVQVLERESSVAGITVVVGDQFPGVRMGKKQVKVVDDGSVCGPPPLS